MDGRDESVSVAPDADDDDNDEDDKYADDMAMPGQKFETKQRITVRNLRIREVNYNTSSRFWLLAQ